MILLGAAGSRIALLLLFVLLVISRCVCCSPRCLGDMMMMMKGMPGWSVVSEGAACFGGLAWVKGGCCNVGR